ncbi:MAG: hypothetical protein HQ582_32820, partial [Planctomycetes bacterium]|nr:hypothetical protein [Planctomycetota bacterium]
MPSRPFHRAFGETSLELKCLFLFGVFLLVVMTISFFLYWRVTQELVDELNPNTGRLLVDQAMNIRHFVALSKDNRDFQKYFEGVTEDLQEQQFEWRFIKRPDWILRQTEGVSPPADEFEEELLRRFSQAEPDSTGEPDEPQEADWADRFVLDGDE